MKTLIEPPPFEGTWATLADAAGIVQCLACMTPLYPDDGARIRYQLPDGSWTPWADVCVNHVPEDHSGAQIIYGANTQAASA